MWPRGQIIRPRPRPRTQPRPHCFSPRPWPHAQLASLTSLFVGGRVGCVQVTATPYTPLEFVSKRGTLEVPPTGAIGKVDKYRCLANTAIV